MQIIVAPDAQEAADIAAARVASRVRDAVRRRGRAAVAFSGGTTPRLMLRTLAGLDLPWGQVQVFQVDERVAPDGHPDRNAPLLDVLPIPSRNLVLMPVAARSLDAAIRRYARRLPERLDVVHLGIGDDGHTASWPPGDPVIDSPEAVGLCGEFNGRVRVTLTPRSVNSARCRLVLATGASKAAVIERWLLRDRSLPIQRVQRTATVVVLDAAAASRLPEVPH